MEIINVLFHSFWSFILVISVIVFIHEFGHYIIAKFCGVKIDSFSIGFGKEIFGYSDKSGTRWKFSILPLGGYVKMFGDSSEASTADAAAIDQMSEAEKKLTFHHKPLYKKAAIVAAGPFFNFILTIAIFTYFIMSVGLPSIDPVIGGVLPESPAEIAGIKTGDKVLKINNREMKHFNDITYNISMSGEKPVTVEILRGNDQLFFTITPKLFEDDDGLGNKIKIARIGVKSQNIIYREVGPLVALGEAISRTYLICESTLKVIGQMVRGERSVDELKGPIGIAQLSGQATEQNLHTVLWLMAMLSANLGLVNLLPIPMLDGGHLTFYLAEAIRGRPLAEKVQDWSMKIGSAILMTLMAFTLFNDISKLI